MSDITPAVALDILRLGNVTSIAAGGNSGSTYSKAFKLPFNAVFSVEIQLSGAGTQDLQVELEQSTEPVTNEYASDSNFVVPDNKIEYPVFEAVTDTNVHFAAYSPVITSYARFKFSGNSAANASDVEVTRLRLIKLIK